MKPPRLTVLDGGRPRTGTAPHACTWCGEQFVSHGELKSHWALSPECAINKSVSSATDSKTTFAVPGGTERLLLSWLSTEETVDLLTLVIDNVKRPGISNHKLAQAIAAELRAVLKAALQ